VSVTPPTLAPADRTDGFSVDIPEAGALQPPSGSDKLLVSLGDVVIDGAFPELSGPVTEIVAGFRGRRVSLTEIFAVASEIEAAHAQAGYVLARVTVPPQQLVDGGALRLVVTDGLIEDVGTTALSPRVQEATAERVASLKGKSRVRLAEIEEALSLAADLPSLALRSTLMRGVGLYGLVGHL
jgi:hemolysin activation/secretion protein